MNYVLSFHLEVLLLHALQLNCHGINLVGVIFYKIRDRNPSFPPLLKEDENICWMLDLLRQ